MHGKYGGIGARIERDADGQYRLYPFLGSPAETTGVAEGDILLAVEDLEILPETPVEEIQAAIRGPVGEKVTITVKHDEDGEITLIED